jgi:hypothetical protein
MPEPETSTVSERAGALAPWKDAGTLLSASIVSVHVASVPAHVPPQPEKTPPEGTAAVNVTVVPCGND